MSHTRRNEQESVSYDLNGNLVSDGKRGFDYDDENQLIRVTVTNAWKSEFVYDGKMRRRIRVECAWNGSGWTTNQIVCYVYDGNLVIQERDLNPQLLTGIPQPSVTYTRGLDLSGSFEGAGGIGGLLARSAVNSQPATHAYYHADGNGNITALIDANQTLVAKYLYDPFGGILAQSGTLAEVNLYRFSSKEHHPNSGLVYYLYRAYDAGLHRWLNRDPFTEAGFESLRKHRSFRRAVLLGSTSYRFVRNSPIGVVDPDGLTIRFDPESPDPFVQHWRDCICTLMSSPNGRNLLLQVAGNDYDVLITADADGPYHDPGDPYERTPDTIGLDPRHPLGVGPEVFIYPGEELPPTLGGCAAVLAHEFGHILGELDEPFGRNVARNENPVRIDLGLEPRPSWRWYPVFNN